MFIFFACLACQQSGDDTGSEESTKIKGHHEAHGRFWLLSIGNTEEPPTPKQPTSNQCFLTCLEPVYKYIVLWNHAQSI